MAYTYEQLKEMTIAQLREIAQGLKDDSLEGLATMHKDKLLPLMCKVMGIHIHHAAAGTEKSRLKGEIHQLQKQRDEIAASGDRAKLTTIVHSIHRRKHLLRRMVELGK